MRICYEAVFHYTCTYSSSLLLFSEEAAHCSVSLDIQYFVFLSLFTLNFSDVFIVHDANLVLKTEWLFNSTCQYAAPECLTNTDCVVFLIFS